MGKLKNLLLASVLMFCAASCFAKQLSFQIVQHDGDREDIIEQSQVIEDEILNGFFDKGYIVTNSPAAVSDSKEQDEVLYASGIKEAVEGYSDYFIQIKLYFLSDEDGDSGKYAGLTQIEWSVYSVEKGKKIKTDTVSNIKIKNLRETDELKSISYDLIADLYKAVK